MWIGIPGRRFGYRTWPQIAFMDPDLLYWAVDEDKFGDDLELKYQMNDVALKARNIRVPASEVRGAAAVAVDYIIHPARGLFARLEVVPAGQPPQAGAERCDRIDLSYPRRIKNYDKLGGKLIVTHLRRLLLPARSRMTKWRCEAFFSNSSNFILPTGYRAPFLGPIPTPFCTGGCPGHCSSWR